MDEHVYLEVTSYCAGVVALLAEKWFLTEYIPKAFLQCVGACVSWDFGNNLKKHNEHHTGGKPYECVFVDSSNVAFLHGGRIYALSSGNLDWTICHT